MDSTHLTQPRKTKTSVDARCRHCGAVVYAEIVTDELGVPVEREVRGQFRQALDAEGLPLGPVIPFCTCKEI